ncbi:hypothetical protein EVG20_g1690 [Dentipellis fragilis]|uniref:AAA+ ATPase domain-containing protein n=1 Tax=Dentipellis fragilis TaxID=205917 RepID=A0A4Y9ZBD5_9AGAM|nr:hypothetical protein EVG20_g1690 [Dentipellis fragilis]
MLTSAFRAGRSKLLYPVLTRFAPFRFYNSPVNMGSGAQTVNTSDRLSALRRFMAEKPVDAYVVPSEDQRDEYPAECDERRAFISGFNGSAGTAIVTKENAYLFTDGRYFLQAEQQLDKNWTLMKQGLPDVPTWQDFINKKLPNSDRVGIDPELISATDAKSFTDVKFTFSENLVDKVWVESRPPRPKETVFPLEVKFSGESHVDKLAKLRNELQKKDAGAMVVTMLDEVAWLFNLRGSDIAFNPVFFGYAVVTAEKAVLFIDPAQVNEAVRSHLGLHVELKSYTDFWSYLKGLAASLRPSSAGSPPQVLLGDKASVAVAEAVGQSHITIARSPVADLKALKNETEVAGFRASHIRDGAALARYFAWLEEQLNAGKTLTESEAADQLEKYRSEQDLFKGLSFPTISATGPNGAIIHYQPDPNDCAVVKKEQIYLCDSGAQFMDGTTDVTRTWHFGTPTDEEKRAFTRVLQGHIAIDTAVFPNGTSGYIIDTWARRALWKDGLDYRHGTGHGVGHFLNVHEGPQGIGTRIAYNSTPLKPGMTVSNEPGYYADGRFGIRIENVVVVREVHTPHNFGGKGFLGFEHVTMCPIHKNLIDAELLSINERDWLNEYHQEVLEKVAPLLKNDERALAWLQREYEVSNVCTDKSRWPVWIRMNAFPSIHGDSRAPPPRSCLSARSSLALGLFFTVTVPRLSVSWSTVWEYNHRGVSLAYIAIVLLVRAAQLNFALLLPTTTITTIPQHFHPYYFALVLSLNVMVSVIMHCDLCNARVSSTNWDEHERGRRHRRNEATTATLVPVQTPSPTPSDSTALQTPPTGNNGHINEPGIVDGLQEDDALNGQITLHNTEDADDEHQDLADDIDGDGDHPNVPTNLVVSDEDGLDFGEVGRAGDRGQFPSTTKTITITRTNWHPGIKLVDIKIWSNSRAARQCFSAELGEGSSQWVKHGRPRTVLLSFNPSRDGYFRATVRLTFISNGSQFIINRALTGTAAHPLYRPPTSVVSLRPPTWTRTRWSKLLPEYELPAELAATVALPNPEQHEDKIRRIANIMVPSALTMDTYVSRFHALLHIEEVAQQRHLQETMIPDVDVKAKHPRYEATFSESEDQELPDAGMVGDYVLLDDCFSDMCYEGRVHARRQLYNNRTNRHEITLVLRMPEAFTIHHGSIFNLRFKLNRIPLQRAHHALAQPCHLRRLLFPTRSDEPNEPRTAVDREELELYNRAVENDDQQLQAVLEILQRPRGNVPLIIFGPPGTGKTTTIVECILQLLLHNPSSHILVCTPSNSAADLLTARLAVHLDKVALFRLNAFSRSPDDIANAHRPAVLERSLRNDHNVFAMPSGKDIAKFRVVVCTCCTAGALTRAGVSRGHFGWIFIDEAAQATEPEAMVPIRGMVGEKTDVVLVGDPKQLRPVIMSMCAKPKLGISYLERLIGMRDVYDFGEGSGEDGRGNDPPPPKNVVQLQQNRRSQAAIIAFSNSLFYEDALRARADLTTTRSLLHSAVLPNREFPIMFHGIKGREEQRKLSKSFYNTVEAQQVLQYCQTLLGDHERPVSPEEIGIISPYKAQVRYIKSMLRGARIEGVTVGSVEQFQGQERRVIILSTTRSNFNRNKKAFGFLNDPHRLNVALTRAQAMLIVIGDPTVLGQDLLWRTFLNYVHKRGGRMGESNNVFGLRKFACDSKSPLETMACRVSAAASWPTQPSNCCLLSLAAGYPRRSRSTAPNAGHADSKSTRDFYTEDDLNLEPPNFAADDYLCFACLMASWSSRSPLIDVIVKHAAAGPAIRRPGAGEGALFRLADETFSHHQTIDLGRFLAAFGRTIFANLDFWLKTPSALAARTREAGSHIMEITTTQPASHVTTPSTSLQATGRCEASLRDDH